MAPNGSIRSAAVLGAGVMGAQIAAHLANASVPTVLLDLTPEVAREGLARARALKPDPFFVPEVAALIETGGFDQDLERLGRVDLVIEAVVERLDVKRALLERVDGVRAGSTIVSSNTSGIPLAAIGEGRSDGFQRHWLGTHFFNPPRYLHLLEVIPTDRTDGAVVERVRRFADLRLGKGVVVAKDRPNFIANHLGIYSAVESLRALDTGEFTIEEIDAITGTPLGRPKSATFRTMDIAGLDVVAHVASNVGMPVPAVLQKLIDRGWIGEKAGQGFYKRTDSEILVLDAREFVYRPRAPVDLPALETAQRVPDLAERTRMLFLDGSKVGRLLRSTLGPTLVHAARIAPEVAHSIDDVDRAMRWGYGWELGPFEIWDAVGVRRVLDAVHQGGEPAEPPPLVHQILQSGGDRFRAGGPPPAGPGLLILKAARAQNRLVRGNSAASLVDLGDGVLAVEFHSKMNTIGGDTLQMIKAGLREASRQFAALVIGNEAPNFSAGANLLLVLLEAQEGNWDEIDLMIRTFQEANQALRYAEVPVVAAPAGLALGGGCEIALHADRLQAAAESYIGLVETGVGLIPAAGGVKEMLARAMGGQSDAQADLLPAVRRTFETIAFARVSTSARDAVRLGFLRDADQITMNRERLMQDAKALALERVREGYRPPCRRAIRVGGDGVLAALKLGIHLAWRAGRISDHDRLIGHSLAQVIAGGSLPHSAVVSEQHVLDLEREAFLRLCGERKTLERIQHTLKTGKTLRN
jgi:3-hydroxyacyl-CoA dehydrogenase